MKRLTVLRHAKSSSGDPSLGDLDRPLNERGWKDARRLGKEMTRRQMHFDLVLASPAVRVRETLDGLREKFDMHSVIRFEPRMYGASERTLLSLVRSLPQTVQSPLLVGHNPGLEQLIVGVTQDDEQGLRCKVANKYPTAALAVIRFRAERWQSADQGSGEMIELILPKDLH